MALAHVGPPPTPADWWAAWDAEPSVVLGLALVAWLYATGLRALWRRVGTGRVVQRWQAAAFGGGLAAVALALLSPLDALGTALFAAHMVQHLLLLLLAPPLLVLGAPLLAGWWALPAAWRAPLARWWRRHTRLRALAHALTLPAVAWLLQAVVLWTWHLPSLYQAALGDASVHFAEHASFLATALLFWWTAIGFGPRASRRYGASLVYLFAAALASGALGALLTFARTPWYPVYAPTAAAWGLTALADQQLAGLIMWVPAGLIYLVAAAALFVAWLRAQEEEARRAEV